MTSDEIKKSEGLNPEYWWIWLQECAYQLAVMNERNASGDQEAVDEMLKKVGLGSQVGAGSDTEVRGDQPSDKTERGDDERELDRWNMPDWVCKCGYTNRAIRSKCRNFTCGLPRPADERTTHPNPQAASIQTQEDQSLSYLMDQIRIVADAVLEVAPEKQGTGSACAVAAEMIRSAYGRTTPPNPQTTSIQPQEIREVISELVEVIKPLRAVVLFTRLGVGMPEKRAKAFDDAIAAADAAIEKAEKLPTSGPPTPDLADSPNSTPKS